MTGSGSKISNMSKADLRLSADLKLAFARKWVLVRFSYIAIHQRASVDM